MIDEAKISRLPFQRIVANRFYSRFFVDYIANLQAVYHLQQLYTKGETKIFSENDSFVIQSKQLDKILIFYPYHVVSSLIRGESIRKITIKSMDVEPLRSEDRIDLGPLNRIFIGLAQTMFSNYFESYKPRIIKLYGPAERWPEIWNFGRLVRNAMSHGGRLEITGKNPRPATWKNLSYDKASHGKVIFHTDIWLGDLFYLMAEMDDSLMAALYPELKRPADADLPYGDYIPDIL